MLGVLDNISCLLEAVSSVDPFDGQNIYTRFVGQCYCLGTEHKILEYLSGQAASLEGMVR